MTAIEIIILKQLSEGRLVTSNGRDIPGNLRASEELYLACDRLWNARLVLGGYDIGSQWPPFTFNFHGLTDLGREALAQSAT